MWLPHSTLDGFHIIGICCRGSLCLLPLWQVGMSGFDATVPQFNPFNRQSNGSTFWDSATGTARAAAPAPAPSSRGKRGNGSGGGSQTQTSEQHAPDRQASGKAPRAFESDQTAPSVARATGLSRWTSESRHFRGLFWLSWRIFARVGSSAHHLTSEQLARCSRPPHDAKRLVKKPSIAHLPTGCNTVGHAGAGSGSAFS